MNGQEHGTNFWLGNAILALALLMLLDIGAFWEWMGVWAIAIWAALAGVGAYLLMKDESGGPGMPG